jgi:hypothetical protein
MFCDQTTDTAKKVANRGTTNGVRRPSKDSDSEEKKHTVLVLGQVLSSVSVGEFALLYCRSHHLVRLPEANECLKVVYERLLCCLKALGSASYSTTIQSPQLAAQGRKYYVSANSAAQSGSRRANRGHQGQCVTHSHYPLILRIRIWQFLEISHRLVAAHPRHRRID